MKIPWRRVWQPTPVFLPGKSLDRGAWGAIVYEVRKSWTQLNTHLPAQLIYNVVLVLGVQKSDSVIHTHIYIYIFFQIIFPLRLLQNIEYSLTPTAQYTHLHLPFCRISFWSELRTSLKPSTVSPGIPARSQLSPAPQLTAAWWASTHTAASSGSASQSQHREIIKVLPFPDSKYEHLMHLKDCLCWSWKKWTFDSYVMKRVCPTHNQANQNDCLK